MRIKHWMGAMALCAALAIATPALAAPTPVGPDWASAAAHGTTAAGAEATTAGVFTQADTPGDVPYGSGDITAIKVEHRTSTVRLSLRTKLGSNPATSASWRGGYTWIVWAIDVNNGGGPDFLAGIFNDGSGVFTEVVRNDANFTHRCDTTFTHNESNQFQIEFNRSCISSHPAIRAYATMQYDRYPTNPNAPVSVDYSPNATWTPNVTRAS